MIVTCEDCGASFKINDSMIKPTGSKVRCSKCKNVFTVLPPAAAPAEHEATAGLAAGAGSVSDNAPAAGDETLAELDSKLDDIFGEEGHESALDDLGEMSDLDLASAELSADLPEGGADDLLAGLDSEDQDLELHETAGLDEIQAAADDGELAAADDDLDLDLDLLAGDEGEAELSDDELPQIDDLLDLGGEDFDLEDDSPIEAPEAAADGIDEDLSDSLDLADLDPSSLSDDGELDLDELDLDELDLGAELELGDADAIPDAPAETDAGAGDGLDIDEIDLSDIEEMLSDDDVLLGSESDAPSGEGLDDGDIGDLDLSDFARELAEGDVQSEVDAPVAGNDAEMDLDLDLDLDLGDEIEPAPSEPAAEAPGDELDFTDLADMLEPGDTPEGTGEVADDPSDLELDLLGMDDDADAGTDEKALDLDSMLDGSAAAGEEEELDLTIELDGLSDDSQDTVDSEPELEFDLESDLGEQGGGFDQEDELELNLLDDDEAAFGAGDDATQALTTDAAAVTGGLAAGAQEIGATTDDFATEEFTDARDLTDESDYMSADDAAMPPINAKPGRSRKPLIAVLAGIVLVLAALVVPNLPGIHVPVLSDIRIPFLSDLFGKNESSDPGNLKIVPLGKTINAKYVSNQTAGKLLVISGQVRNEYNHARSGIKVAGKLFNKDGSMAKSATVYAGNMIPTLDLARLNLAKIKASLQNASGQRNSNLNVKNGRVVPFMIVFDDLPEGLDEYTVEVVGSSRKK